MRTWRVASHVHSTWSYDGSWSLEELSRGFGRRGYDAVLMSEHDRGWDEERRTAHRAACRVASAEGALLVSGVEYSDAENVVHVLVWGDVPFLGEGRETVETLRAAREGGGVTVLAHPTRRDAWKRWTPEWAGLLHGVEAWNRKTDGWRASEDAWGLIDQGPRAFVGHDFHRSRQFFPMGLRVRAESLEEGALLGALREGRFSARVVGMDVHGYRTGVLRAAARCAETARRAARDVVARRRGRANRAQTGSDRAEGEGLGR